MVERDLLRLREAALELLEGFAGCAAETINRLVRISDRKDVAFFPGQPLQNFHLGKIDVLKFVHQGEPAARLKLQGADTFLTSAIWASIGHSVGAAMGTAMRVIAICGDGQIMATTLSTMVRQAQRTVVIVVDNGMYGIEQFLRDKSR